MLDPAELGIVQVCGVDLRWPLDLFGADSGVKPAARPVIWH